MNQLTEKPSIKILFEPQAHRYAQQFASQQVNLVKGKQVYLNTLAVYSVHTYLKCLDINSNLADSGCWQKSERALLNIADLILPNIGKLECCCLLPEEQEVRIPLEARSERIGYMVVQFAESLGQAKLVGFIAPEQVKFDTEAIALDRLQSLETLFDIIASGQNKINLRQWFSDVFSPDWQPVELILAGRITRSLTTIKLGTVSGNLVTRGKVIQWQLNSLEQEIILVLRVVEQSSSEIDLCLQLYPGSDQGNLPSGLSVQILDQSNQPCLSAQAKNTDDWMQLEFSCQQGEQFQVKLELGGVSMVEYFSV